MFLYIVNDQLDVEIKKKKTFQQCQKHVKYFGTDLTKYVQEFYSKITILYTCNLYNIVEQLQRSPGEGNGNPLQYSCLENPMVGEVWQAYSPWGHRVGQD